ncbi:MAG: DDE-type integrase/transposase/recombinase [Nitrospirae bacterium]|nr:DDE-type integrase/transposase/recombinase [Nitrospirota bacterium]
MPWTVDFTRELTAAANNSRSLVLEKYQEMSGLSVPQLYKIAKQSGWKSGRKPRADKGELKTGISDTQVEFIAALLYETGRENKGPIMPVERAIQIAEDNGIIQRGQIAPATMNRILRERQMSKEHQKAEEPHTEMRSLHPNHCHLFDASVCIQYYLKNGKLAIMDERDFYKNKPENFAKVKLRLLRYVLVDHFSGAFFFRYYNTTGETQENLWNFLKDAWTNKQNEKFPFRGVPYLMLMDTGAANKSHAIVSFLTRLEVEIPKGLPYNPRRQGAVETSHNIIEEWFESGLRIQPATSVEEMNAWADDFMSWHQATKKHSRHDMTRTACWSLIKQEQLRELPAEDILQDLFANPSEERTVDGTYSISFRSKEYQLKHVEGLFRGAKVQAVLRPFAWPEIEVRYREKAYQCQPIPDRLPAVQGGFSANAAIIGQEYKAQPETATQQAIKRFDNAAYGEGGKKKNAVPFEGLVVHGIHAEKLGNVAYLEKKGTAIEVDRGITERVIPFAEFLKDLMREIGRVSPELNQQLRADFGASITKSKAEEVIEQLLAGSYQPSAANSRSGGAEGNEEDKEAIAM